VAFVPGLAFCADRSDSNTLRLKFTHPSPESIREGIARLGQIFARIPGAERARERILGVGPSNGFREQGGVSWVKHSMLSPRRFRCVC
jgi:hypothetical protein